MFEGLGYFWEGLLGFMTVRTIFDVFWSTQLGIIVGMLPGLKVIADKHRVEPGLLGLDGEFQQRVGRELLSRSLVSETHIVLLGSHGWSCRGSEF